jgi:membrane-bound lytic murein transglycosylase B
VTPPESAGQVIDPAAFAKWLEGVHQQGLKQGIAESTLRATLDKAEFLPEVIAKDQYQPEFTRPVWQYLDSAVSPARVKRGQEVLSKYQKEAKSAADHYGVPGSIIVAIWGIESNYGSNFGTFQTVDALATLGFQGRRQAWARGQLLDALRIIDRGDIAADRMIGSWAGAMGNTQFLPSSFLKYAVDADGDGRRDIWGSVPDVLASTANFLSQEGWQTGQTWGQEVMLPTGFNYALADSSKTRLESAQWEAMGVRAAAPGTKLDTSIGAAALLLPAGAKGPAFLVGQNFRTILRYNNSTSYALAVGLLSRAIDGFPGLVSSWPRDTVTLGKDAVRQMQTLLNGQGLDAGEADGLMGPATAQAVRQWQQKVGLPADGFPTMQLLERLKTAP